MLLTPLCFDTLLCAVFFMAMLYITSSIFDNYKNAFIDSFLSILDLYFEKKILEHYP